MTTQLTFVSRYFNIGQLLVIPHPAVPDVAVYLFGLNF